MSEENRTVGIGNHGASRLPSNEAAAVQHSVIEKGAEKKNGGRKRIRRERERRDDCCRPMLNGQTAMVTTEVSVGLLNIRRVKNYRGTIEQLQYFENLFRA